MVAAAPFCPGCPAGYSGWDGVVTSDSQARSASVPAMPSVPASVIAVNGRQVTSFGSTPYDSFAVQMVNAVSAIAMFRTARSRLLADRDKWLARAIWFAAWFQWTLALPSQNGARAVSSSVRVDSVLRPSAFT